MATARVVRAASMEEVSLVVVMEETVGPMAAVTMEEGTLATAMRAEAVTVGVDGAVATAAEDMTALAGETATATTVAGSRVAEERAE